MNGLIDIFDLQTQTSSVVVKYLRALDGEKIGFLTMQSEYRKGDTTP